VITGRILFDGTGREPLGDPLKFISEVRQIDIVLRDGRVVWKR